MQIIKSIATTKTNRPLKSERVIYRGEIALFVVALVIAFLLGTSSFQTYWSKKRPFIAAANEIVTALKAYRDSSPGTAKEFPLELTDLSHAPRMLADISYFATLPVDPITPRQAWGLVRHKIIMWSVCIVGRTIHRRYSQNSFHSKAATNIPIGNFLRSDYIFRF